MTTNFSIIFVLLFTSFSFHSPNRKEYYDALEGSSVEKIEVLLEQYNQLQSNSLLNAYKGGLLMKKSSSLKNVTEKVSVFKEGKELLETEIENNPENAEYHFIRLAVQEHAPKIVKYNQNITDDKKIIIKAYSSLNNDLKTIILTYSKSSQHLNPSDFK